MPPAASASLPSPDARIPHRRCYHGDVTCSATAQPFLRRRFIDCREVVSTAASRENEDMFVDYERHIFALLLALFSRFCLR